jgi:hypothetical protein
VALRHAPTGDLGSDDARFVSNLVGWRRDVFEVCRWLVGASALLATGAVVLIPFLDPGDGSAARVGAVCLMLLLLLGPIFAPPMTLWCSRTVSFENGELYAETYLGGRRVLPASDMRRLAIRALAGRGGVSYFAAIWLVGRRWPSVVLAWSAVLGPTEDLVRELADLPHVVVTRRAKAHFGVADAPEWPERLLLACRTWLLAVLYVGASFAVTWGYAYVFGGAPGGR